MQVEIPGAIGIENANCFVGRNGLRPLWIILHGTAGGESAAAIANYFASTQGGPNPVSAHIVIDQSGNIVQCNSLGDGAWANGATSQGCDSWWLNGPNPNNVTISIEHVKASKDNSDSITPEQQASSFAVIAFLCQKFDIPARVADEHGGITGHFSIDPINRSRCPGAYPWAALWNFLEEELIVHPYNPNSSDFNRYFIDNKTTWVCARYGSEIRGGNLALYQSLSVDGNTVPIIGLPRTSELPQTDANGYAWTVQFFERGVIVYDPQHVKDSQPGMGTSYLGKYEQFIALDPSYKASTPITTTTPQTITIGKIPDAVIADIKQLDADIKQLDKDAGM